jgi:hypothetical protein
LRGSRFTILCQIMRGCGSLAHSLASGLAYDDISASGPNAGEWAGCYAESRIFILRRIPALPHYAPQRGKDSIIDLDATYVM